MGNIKMKIVILQAICMVVYLSNMALAKIQKQSIDILSREESEYKFLEKSSNATAKPKGGAVVSKNTTVAAPGAAESNSTQGHSKIIDKAPYLPTDCSETVLIKAKRLVHDNDYANKKDSVFTMSALRINIFDSMDANSLVNSKRVPGLSHRVNVLKGSANCLFFQDSKNRQRNISMCIEDKNTTAHILDAFAFFHKCSELVVRSLSEEDSLEKLLNTLDNPKQEEYKIPNFKRALAESLTEKGFFVSESTSPDAKSNCREDAPKHKIPQPKTMKSLVNFDELHHLDKDIPLVPGTVPPKDNQRIMAAANHKKNNLK